MSDYVPLPLSGTEPPLSEMERAVQDNVHRYAVEVMRPLGPMLDKLPAEARAGRGFADLGALAKAGDLGLSILAMMELPPAERVKLLAIATEELAWGDGGIAGAILVNNFPVMYSLLAGNLAMARYCDGKLGCWGITEPDHGSDMLDATGVLAAPNGSYGKPNCTARIVGDKIIVNGQKAAWVSGAMTAQVCALFCQYQDDKGDARPGMAVIVPLDLPGVSRGKPLDKLGLRGLNQGEFYFDNVEVPMSHLLAGPDQYEELAYHMLCEANPHVACVAVGLARAAFEQAWEYAHRRTRAGVPIIRHQHVRFRLFEMFRKVEAARALTRRVIEYNATAARPSMLASRPRRSPRRRRHSKSPRTRCRCSGATASVANTRWKSCSATPAMLIADGNNEILAMKGSSDLVNPDWL